MYGEHDQWTYNREITQYINFSHAQSQKATYFYHYTFFKNVYCQCTFTSIKIVTSFGKVSMYIAYIWKSNWKFVPLILLFAVVFCVSPTWKLAWQRPRWPKYCLINYLGARRNQCEYTSFFSPLCLVLYQTETGWILSQFLHFHFVKTFKNAICKI